MHFHGCGILRDVLLGLKFVKREEKELSSFTASAEGNGVHRRRGCCLVLFFSQGFSVLKLPTFLPNKQGLGDHRSAASRLANACGLGGVFPHTPHSSGVSYRVLLTPNCP